MTGKCFVDTNVLLYSFDRREPQKCAAACALIRGLESDANLVVSSQVLQEFYVASTHPRKLALPAADADNVVQRLAAGTVVHVTPPMVVSAIHRHRADVLSFWDALIIESAIAGGCTTLYTEDLNNGQMYGPLRVVNSFD